MKGKSDYDEAKNEARELGIDFYDNKELPASSGKTNAAFYGQLRSITSTPVMFRANVTVKQALEILTNGSCGD